jgi:predicted lactoylglutathione lyase
MSRQIFISLTVKDLKKAMAFYTAIGAVNNPQFTDDTAACMVFSDHIFVMLLTEAKRAEFTTKPNATGEVALCITCDSRAAVDEFVKAGVAQGGAADTNPPQDHGFMYQRSLEDPDGHLWEPTFMDMSQFPKS